MREWFNIKIVDFIIYSVDFSFPLELFYLNTTYKCSQIKIRILLLIFLMSLQCYIFPKCPSVFTVFKEYLISS
jgi:hypothetical protein